LKAIQLTYSLTVLYKRLIKYIYNISKMVMEHIEQHVSIDTLASPAMTDQEVLQIIYICVITLTWNHNPKGLLYNIKITQRPPMTASKHCLEIVAKYLGIEQCIPSYIHIGHTLEETQISAN
jgi:hypothetical protein